MKVSFSFVLIAIAFVSSVINLGLVIWLSAVTIQKPWSGVFAAKRGAFVDLHVSGDFVWDNMPNMTDDAPISIQQNAPDLLLNGSCGFDLAYSDRGHVYSFSMPLSYNVQDVLLVESIYARIVTISSSMDRVFQAVEQNATQNLHISLNIQNFVPDIRPLISTKDVIVDSANFLLVDGGVLPSQLHVETRFDTKLSLSDQIQKSLLVEPNFEIRVFKTGSFSFVAGINTK